MPKGKVKKLISDRGFGYIEQEESKKDLWFHANEVKGAVGFDQLQEGRTVEYVIEQGLKGPQASAVRVITEHTEQIPQESIDDVTVSRNDSPYRFLNPYNFVRFLVEPDTTAEPILGKCPPPPHDRFVGYSGTIHCQIETVTPLFISDAEEVHTVFDDHKIYRFFQWQGKPAIPASSLRGMIRTVFEAATNSCMAVFEGRRLSRRLKADVGAKLIPARVHNEGTSWRLELLTGTLDGPYDKTEKGEINQFAAWLLRYWPVEESKTLREDPQRPNQQQLERIHAFRDRTAKARTARCVDVGDLKHGSECYALLQKLEHPFPKIICWDVVQLAKTEKELLPLKEDGQRIEHGYLCLTNQNTEKKHSERFFFHAKDTKTPPVMIELEEKIRNDYEALIREYQEQHKSEIRERKKQPIKPNQADRGSKTIAFSRFTYEPSDLKLKHGDLVYTHIKQTPSGAEVAFLAPVLVPRALYENSIHDLLEKHYYHLKRCTKPDELCPACRVFGWVQMPDNNETREEVISTYAAYASRVEFSMGKLQKKPKRIEKLITLSILSSPKPTTTRFYLAPADSSLKKQWKGQNAEAGYDGNNMLRGRKFYRNHGQRWLDRTFANGKHEYERVEGKTDKHNRTISGVLDTRNIFAFDVRFQNLAPVELGALLWALELDDGLVHRLGYARPLGFGSVKIEVQEIDLLNSQLRYSSSHSGDRVNLANASLSKRKLDFIQLFKVAMAAAYGYRFDDLESIRDLKKLLSGKDAPLPIHYPRSSHEPEAEGKQYEWFMGNNRNKACQFALHYAEEDSEGLPLISKSGRIMSR
ncbi:MAG: TIGR03986 family CRISPR-associated RAMP protein [bacterium]